MAGGGRRNQRDLTGIEGLLADPLRGEIGMVFNATSAAALQPNAAALHDLDIRQLIRSAQLSRLRWEEITCSSWSTLAAWS